MAKRIFNATEIEKENMLLFHFHRGQFISEFASLEKFIDMFLTKYFTGKEEYKDFNNIILDRLTFEMKRQSLNTILSNLELSNGFVKTKKNSFSHNKLMDNLVKLNNIRNKFAHSMVVNVADKNANYAMALVSFRDDVNVTYYSPKEYDNLLMMINSCRIEIELKTENL